MVPSVCLVRIDFPSQQRWHDRYPEKRGRCPRSFTGPRAHQPFPKNGRRTGSLLCTREMTFIGDVYEAFDHAHERFCPPCRIAVIARHYRGCETAAAEADRWTDEDLAAVELEV